MTSHGEWTPHGWFRLAFPVFIRGMRGPERGVIAKARRALEEELDRQSRRSPTPIAGRQLATGPRAAVTGKSSSVMKAAAGRCLA